MTSVVTSRRELSTKRVIDPAGTLMKSIPAMPMMLTLAAGLIPALATASPASIISASPFLPPGFAPPGGSGSGSITPADETQLSFKGVYQLDGEFYFHLYDKREQRGQWIRLGEALPNGPRIVRYEQEADVILVESGQRRLRLEMVAASRSPAALARSGRSSTLAIADAGRPATRPGTVTRRRVLRTTSAETETDTGIVRRVTLPTQSAGN